MEQPIRVTLVEGEGTVLANRRAIFGFGRGRWISTTFGGSTKGNRRKTLFDFVLLLLLARLI